MTIFNTVIHIPKNFFTFSPFKLHYRNVPKFSDRQVCANSADPDQTLIRVYTVCHSVCIVWTHYSMVELHTSNFRVITTNFLGVRIFRKFTVVCTNLWKPYVRQWKVKLQHDIRLLTVSGRKYEPRHDKTNKMSAPSKDSDQPGHPSSLISLHYPHEETLGP